MAGSRIADWSFQTVNLRFDMDARILKKLGMSEWRDFGKYPSQGSSIYVYCIPPHGFAERFVMIENFNASLFDPKTLLDDQTMLSEYRFLWLPANQVDSKFSLQNEDIK